MQQLIVTEIKAESSLFSLPQFLLVDIRSCWFDQIYDSFGRLIVFLLFDVVVVVVVVVADCD